MTLEWKIRIEDKGVGASIEILAGGCENTNFREMQVALAISDHLSNYIGDKEFMDKIGANKAMNGDKTTIEKFIEKLKDEKLHRD